MLVFNSCEKVNMQKSQSLADFDKLDLTGINVSFKDNMLVFGSTEDYLKMKDLSTTNSFDQRLKSFFPAFKSVEDVYNEFIESDKYKNLTSLNEIYQFQDKIRIIKSGDEIIIDPKLDYEKAKLYNQQGMIRIGDEIIQREHDKISILKISSVKNFNNLAYEFLNNKSVKVTELLVLTRPIKNFNIENEFLEKRSTTTYDCAVYWCSTITSTSCSSQKYRVRGEVSVKIDDGNYKLIEFGANTKSYKRGLFGIWAASSEGFWLEQNGVININYTRFSDNTFFGSINFDVTANSVVGGSTNTIIKGDVAPDSNTRFLNWTYSVNIIPQLTVGSDTRARECHIGF